jgi:hypothetical protein
MILGFFGEGEWKVGTREKKLKVLVREEFSPERHRIRGTEVYTSAEFRGVQTVLRHCDEVGVIDCQGWCDRLSSAAQDFDF